MSASCNMVRGCTQPITHIGAKGYVYCAGHVSARKGVERCRLMRPWERALIAAGKQLPSYKPGRMPREVVQS